MLPVGCSREGIALVGRACNIITINLLRKLERSRSGKKEKG